ncbi:uncharacterized protein LOC142330739 [Lycorma delicatula]|uniref:uncharacterized protein LOC142330739 n=1 Tax=Lycorma delicatula TaxID=130591 RepID=UPI003F516A09
MYKTLFANVNRSLIAHDLFARIVAEKEINLLAVADPNRYKAAKTSLLTDTEGDVAIMLFSNNIHWRLRFRGKGIVALENESVMLVAVYVSPNTDLADFTRFIDTLQGVIINLLKKLVMLGDFNSKMVNAGSSYTNRRGQILADLMQTTGCRCVNDGTPTYVTRGHQSVIDLTILDNRWRGEQFNLMALPDEITSDHRSMRLDLIDAGFERAEYPRPLDFTADLIEVIVNRTAERLRDNQQQTPEALSNIFMQEIDRMANSTARRRNVYWWTAEIGKLRQELQSLRRRKQRLLRDGREEYQYTAKMYTEARRALNKAIKKKKRECWSNLCKELDTDPWGQAYRIVTKRFGRQLLVLDRASAEIQVANLFPRTMAEDSGPTPCRE